jgi:hypothetical protein
MGAIHCALQKPDLVTFQWKKFDLIGGTMNNHSEPTENDHIYARGCPKRAEYIAQIQTEKGWLASALGLLYHKLSKNLLIIGPISLAWLLFRSLRKPSRLQYPCQQMALMQGSLFVGFIAHKGSERISLPKQLPKLPAKTGLILAAMFLVNMVGAEAKQILAGPVNVNHPAIAAATVPQGKVVRVHSSTATTWDFSSGRYWDHIDQGQVQAMLDRGILELTGETSLPSAWRSVITGYKPGDTIAIKVNNNNARDDGNGELNTNHQVIIAVVAGLKSMGVPETNIYVYDVSRQVIPRQRDGVLTLSPNVNVVHSGNVSWDSQSFTDT